MARTPIHPGEILAAELQELAYLRPNWLTPWMCPQIEFPKSWPANERFPRTPPSAWRVFLGTSPDLWMNLQKTYELDLARQEIGSSIRHIPQSPDRRFGLQP